MSSEGKSNCRQSKEFELKVGPHQLFGIEINPYAFDLAQMTVWIGFIQWQRDNGFPVEHEPILQPLHNFELKDAIIDLTDPANPTEPEWPEADFIVGNPPFLGGKKLRTELGDAYVDKMFSLWREYIHPEADLCCYWFEKARRQIELGKCHRAGLLATQGIRGGANQHTLNRIKATGDIFFAVSDRDWIIDGANVHISIIGFDDGSETNRVLDSRPVEEIHENLTRGTNITQAHVLVNQPIKVLRPPEKGGKFELTGSQALAMLRSPNPNGRPSSDAIIQWANAKTIAQSREALWIIDFPPNLTLGEAACYALPFAHVEKHVKHFRSTNRYQSLRDRWWLHRRPGVELRIHQAHHDRTLCTTMVSKHRLFVWLPNVVQPDKTTYCFGTDNDYFFGVLHSRVHEVWSLAQGTRWK